MSVDISPDGSTLVFDLLGDIYTMPAAGGKAKRIRGGVSWDEHPRFSPDGQRIVFRSDQPTEHTWLSVWIMDREGGNARMLPLDPKLTPVDVPAWMPDGKNLLLHDYESSKLYIQPAEGGTARVVEAGDGHNVAASGVTVDGERFYYLTKAGKRERELFELNRTRGEVRQLSTAAEEPYPSRLVLSRDGRMLAYATLCGRSVCLWVRDLASSDSRPRLLAPNVLEYHTFSATGPDRMPHFAFTPDGRQIIAHAEGGLWRYDLNTRSRTPIPFEADVELNLLPALHFNYSLGADEATITARMIRYPRVSPDGRYVAFEALQRIWVASLESGVARQISLARRDDQSVDLKPVWSPDGRQIAFADWSPFRGGHIWLIAADESCLDQGRCTPKRVTREAALYGGLSFTPDGHSIVTTRAGWKHGHQLIEYEPLNFINWPTQAGLPAPARAPKRALVHIGIADGRIRSLAGRDALPGPYEHIGDAVTFSRDGQKLWRNDRSAGSMLETDLQSGRSRVVFSLKTEADVYAAAVTMSPDGRRALAVTGQTNRIYLLQASEAGLWPEQILLKDFLFGSSSPHHFEVSILGADHAHWTEDGRGFYLSVGNSLYLYDVADLEAARRSGADYEPRRVDISVKVPRDRPKGTLVFKDARIITMRGEEVIEEGDLVVRDHRILAVGRSGSIAIPEGSRVIDASGRTILPGYIDTHFHIEAGKKGILPPQSEELMAHLAFGVTTAYDPQLSTNDRLPFMDLTVTGQLVGPRFLTTGNAARTNVGLGSSVADLEATMQRYVGHYGLSHLKNAGGIPRTHQRWLSELAHRYRVRLHAHVNCLTEAVDGYVLCGHVQSLRSPVMNDVTQLLVQSGITVDATSFMHAGYDLLFYFRTIKPNPLRNQLLMDNPKMARFLPRHRLEGWRGDPSNTSDGHWHRQFGKDLARIVAAGGRVSMGTHGEIPGIGAYLELKSMSMGGLPPHELLRSATIVGAEALGLGEELGSIEPGKIADLQVLNANPLEDIDNTLTVRQVMKNGRLYDADTLAEIYPNPKPAPSLWWHEEENRT